MLFSEWLRENRKEKGVSQEELAQVLGLSGKSAVQHWERTAPDNTLGKRRYPSQDSLEKLSDFLGVSLSFLVQLIKDDRTGTNVFSKMEQSIQIPNTTTIVLTSDPTMSDWAITSAQKSKKSYLSMNLSRDLPWQPFFNPLSGSEECVIESFLNFSKTFLPPEQASVCTIPLINAIRVLKRLDAAEGIDSLYANIINLYRLLRNPGSDGHNIMMKFTRIPFQTPAIAKENLDITIWFQNEYFAKTHMFCLYEPLQNEIFQLVSSEHFRKILNPDPDCGEKNDLDFFALENQVIIYNTGLNGIYSKDICKKIFFFFAEKLSQFIRSRGKESSVFLYCDDALLSQLDIPSCLKTETLQNT